jgi:GTPase
MKPIIDEEEKHTSRINVRIAIIGNVDSGKTTITAALSNPPGVLDDGRGKLRSNVFNFSHEKENGRTSSIAHEIIGYDKNGV